MRRRGLLAAIATALVAVPTASAAEVWPADPQTTIFPATTRPAEAPAVLAIPAARAEYEGGIVAVRPDTDLTITPRVSDLTGPGVIPATRVARYRIGYVRLSRPSTGVDRLVGDGRYPDPLIPIAPGAPIVLPAGETTQIYLRVHVPEDAAAGRYRGIVDLGAAGSLPVRVDVAPVRVDGGSYPVVARLDELALARAHGVDHRDPALIEGVYSSLLPELAALGVSPGTPPFTTPAANPATWALDHDSPLGGTRGAPSPAATLARYERLGFAQSEVPFVPTFPSSEDREFLDEARRRTLASDLGSAFAPAAGRTFALPVDEPTTATYERLRRAAAQLGSAVPRIRLLATEAPHPEALAAIGDVVDIWAPPLWDLYKVPEGIAAVRARGASLWWYVYGSETQRYTPNLLIDKPTTEPRLMGWLAAREGVEGFFYWGLNGWDRAGSVQSPWQDPWYQSHVAEDVGCGTRVVGGNGEASLLYPGPGPHRAGLHLPAPRGASRRRRGPLAPRAASRRGPRSLHAAGRRPRDAPQRARRAGRSGGLRRQPPARVPAGRRDRSGGAQKRTDRDARGLQRDAAPHASRRRSVRTGHDARGRASGRRGAGAVRGLHDDHRRARALAASGREPGSGSADRQPGPEREDRSGLGEGHGRHAREAARPGRDPQDARAPVPTARHRRRAGRVAGADRCGPREQARPDGPDDDGAQLPSRTATSGGSTPGSPRP